MSEPVEPREPAANPPSTSADEFAREAGAASPGIVREFVDFLRENKAWWLTPVIVVLLLAGLLIVLSSTAAAPFIYTIF